jgi:uncharacterized membrane protein YeaQ/YmgE (transglycosylase-associated protein family)
MVFPPLSLLIFLIIAAVCGSIGRAIAGGTHSGCLVSTALGLIGAVLGSWIAHQLRLPELIVIQVGRHPFPILWSIVGSALFVAIVHLLSGRRSRR